METVRQETWELTFHSRRSHVVTYYVFFLSADVILIAVLSFCLFFTRLLSLAKPGPDDGFMIVLQMCMAMNSLLALCAVIQVSSFVLMALRRLISSQPAVLITLSGIECRDLPAIGNLFLPWSDIASFSEVSIQQTPSKSIYYFCIDPKDRVQFLSHFHILQRVFVRLASIATGLLISVPHWYLSEPVGEVLSHIQQDCRAQLNEHHIQVFHFRAR